MNVKLLGPFEFFAPISTSFVAPELPAVLLNAALIKHWRAPLDYSDVKIFHFSSLIFRNVTSDNDQSLKFGKHDAGEFGNATRARKIKPAGFSIWKISGITDIFSGCPLSEKRGLNSGATERSGDAQRLDALTARTHYTSSRT